MTTSTPKPILNGDRHKLGLYVREMADLMGLKDWTISVEDDPADDGSNADVFVVYGQRRARIRFIKDWMTWDAEKLREIVVHELTHCFLHPIRSAIDNVQSIVGEVVYRPLYNSVTDGIEYAVDGIAVAWAKTLPLPVKRKAGRKR